MGQDVQEARERPEEVLPAREHDVSGARQRPDERAGTEQLLPQQRRSGAAAAALLGGIRARLRKPLLLPLPTGALAAGHLQEKPEAPLRSLLSR